MNTKITEEKIALLKQTVTKMMTREKGLLAADESNPTVGKRLATAGVENTEENRRAYRELFLGMDGVEDYVSGVILYDETFWQKANSEETFPELLMRKGIVPGIKVDAGAKDSDEFSGEKVTVGLEGLQDRLQKYFDSGARFAKWRAVIKIDEEAGLPTDGAVEANAENMAQYAVMCQEVGIVPIVEPEVLLIGPHSIEKSAEVTTKTVNAVFAKLTEAGAYMPGLILKTSMVINGNQNPNESSAEEVADATIKMLRESVPAEVGGVVFLSGGQTAVEATVHLDAIAEKGGQDVSSDALPFEIAFSYARALQGPALQAWQGKEENVEAARTEFLKRLKLNKLADAGEYDIEMEYLD